VRARLARARERRPRPRPQDSVLGDQRPVEIEREGGDAGRERGWKLYGVFWVDWTTYAATSAICCVLSFDLNAGMAPPPFVTWAVASR
jgi:hypothetical protein